MKLAIAVLCALVACVAAEKCADVSACSTTSCSGTGYALACAGGQCTCTSAGSSTGSSGGTTCGVPTDCRCPDQNHAKPHCIDGHCRCSRF